MNREEIIRYAKETYHTHPEHPFRTAPDALVLRHEDNRKWYGLFLYVKRSALGMQGDGYMDILNIKADEGLIDFLSREPGFLPAYHMNKKHWLTLLLDGSVAEEQILDLLDKSFLMTASKKTQKELKLTGPKNWLIPANPKYYDVIAAFEESDVIDWKQSSEIRPGDIVYMYVAAPYSSIMYKCEALETDIPYLGHHDELNIRKLMVIRKLEYYKSGMISRDVMKEYNVRAVRGPRSMPDPLIRRINNTKES